MLAAKELRGRFLPLHDLFGFDRPTEHLAEYIFDRPV
jgi:hypothetical protein